MVVYAKSNFLGGEMSKYPKLQGVPRGNPPKAIKEEAAHGDFVAVMKDAVGAGREAAAAVEQANRTAMVALVTREAEREGRDLTKWLFNADKMRWQERTPALPHAEG